jgi:hypothetical protein
MTTDPYVPPKAQIAHVEVSSEDTAVNPHVLWRQLCGLVFWLSPLFLAGLLPGLLGAALGGVTFVDAWVSGIYKRPGTRSLLNISPMSWGVLMLWLFIFTFPLYIINRNRLRTRRGTNVFFMATVIMGTLLLVQLIASIWLSTMQPTT